ncbi:Predicted dehydrogenase [Paenibacillus sp. UNCCL117]|uniref:Gfo/Idh/MocA family protein n=1 Tax=unclassified Paenibacillus TaxID=185978 RepID=UPI000881D11B|nr:MULTISPECIES: Gfo/Idh/MocA family oxidoreductase [unclassified Paenibacillus]SDE56149.1 Predicted dehydrogenase [Paenibacillus sp. cl123]SFW66252.1 Predicted dehydrogenase [Paenibacillus sp. UNCCL117]
MTDKIRIGIIGLGGIGTSKHLPSLAKLPQVEVAAFCDLVEEKAAKAAKEYGTADAKVYTDYRRLLEDSSLDVVHVCTPNSSHAEITVAALEAGKHVMCEKPMAISSADAERMLDASRRTGKKLTIGYQNRFRPDSLYLKQLCEIGELGDIYFGRALALRRRAVPTWGVFLDKELQGGGPLIDIGTHALDLTLWMMDNYKPVSVTGSVFHKLGSTRNAANLWGSWDPDQFHVEDSAFGFIKMENGATISLEASWALNTLEAREAKTTLCGTKGGADMNDGLRLNGERFSRLYEHKVSFDTAPVVFYSAQKDETPADMEARLWIEAVINDTEPVVKPEQALVVSRILEAIYESAATGKTIYLGESASQ